MVDGKRNFKCAIRLCCVNLCIDHGVLDVTWGLYVWPCVHMGVKGSTWFAHWGWEKGMLEEMFPTIPHVFGHFKNKLFVLFVLLKLLCGSKSHWILFDQGFRCWTICGVGGVEGTFVMDDLVNTNERKVCMYISNRVWKKNCHFVTSTKRGDICVWNYH
jgi:hypothetical protein